MNQSDFLEKWPFVPARARKSDPVTSHLAAAEGERTGSFQAQAARVLAAVRTYPGRTSRELAFWMKVDRYIVARRLPELETQGLVRKGAVRECANGKRLAVTWWLA